MGQAPAGCQGNSQRLRTESGRDFLGLPAEAGSSTLKRAPQQQRQ
jgi:hypothetical protein